MAHCKRYQLLFAHSMFSFIVHYGRRNNKTMEKEQAFSDDNFAKYFKVYEQAYTSTL